MISKNARKTTYIFIGIILFGVFVDLVLTEGSFSATHSPGNVDVTADATKATWFWKDSL